jgi:hypothetical protein
LCMQKRTTNILRSLRYKLTIRSSHGWVIAKNAVKM